MFWDKKTVKGTLVEILTCNKESGMYIDTSLMMEADRLAENMNHTPSGFSGSHFSEHYFRDAAYMAASQRWEARVEEDGTETYILSWQTVYHFSAVVSYEVAGIEHKTTIYRTCEKYRPEIGDCYNIVISRKDPSTVLSCRYLEWASLLSHYSEEKRKSAKK